MKPVHWALLIGLSLIWGTSFLFIKVAVQEVSPFWVAGVRILLGALFLLAVLRVTGHSFPARRFWGALFIAGLFSNAFPWVLLAWGEIRIASGLASILNATTPLFSIVLASIWDDEVLTPIRVAGIVIGFAGVFLLLGVDVTAFTELNVLAEVAVLGASCSYAIGAVFVRRRLRAPSSRQLAAGQLVAAFVLISPLMVLDGVPTQAPSLPAAGSLLALGTLGSGLAYLLFFRLLKEVGATRTLIVTYLVPITAVFWGWLILGETFGWQTWLGMATILVGVVLVNSRRGQQPAANVVHADV